MPIVDSISRVALVRHPSVAIASGICYGRLDIRLSLQGHAAIAGIVALLAGFPAISLWTSPARRCSIVAEALGAAFGLRPIPDPRLHELDFGAWEGVPWDAIPRDALDAWAASPPDFAPPGGESGTELIQRVGAFWEMLRREGQPCIVVSHGGPLKLLDAMLRGELPDLLASAPALGSVSIIPH